MTMGPGPISGRAIIKALGRKGEEAAEAREDSESRAALDEEELRELERAEHAAVAPAAPHPSPTVRGRSFLDRLLGR